MTTDAADLLRENSPADLKTLARELAEQAEVGSRSLALPWQPIPVAADPASGWQLAPTDMAAALAPNNRWLAAMRQLREKVEIAESCAADRLGNAD